MVSSLSPVRYAQSVTCKYNCYGRPVDIQVRLARLSGRPSWRMAHVFLPPPLSLDGQLVWVPQGSTSRVMQFKLSSSASSILHGLLHTHTRTHQEEPSVKPEPDSDSVIYFFFSFEIR